MHDINYFHERELKEHDFLGCCKDCLASLDIIKPHILAFAEKIRRYTRRTLANLPHEELYRLYQLLDDLAHMNAGVHLAAKEVPDETVEKLARDPTLVPATRRIARVKRLIGLQLERQSAEAIISHPESWSLLKAFPYFPNYQSLARMEYEGAGLKPGDRIFFLGSGPLPLSLLCLSKGYGLKGVGIEQDQPTAALSRKVIHRLGLSEFITILQGDHYSLTGREPCELMMVGADAVPKKEIFDHLSRACHPGQKISYRIYEKGLRRLLDDQSMFQLPKEFAERARVRPEPPVNNTCVFAVRVS